MDPLDEINAKKFAVNCYLEYQYKHFLKTIPHIFKHVNMDIRPATNEDYYIPPSLTSECKVVKLTFNEIGCQKIACFPYMKNLDKCQPMDEARYLNLGTQFTLACQPGCTQLNWHLQHPTDTEFRNNKCMMVNMKKKMFGLFPETFHNVSTVQPLNVGFDLVNGNLQLNRDYCKYYGLDFKDGKCENYKHQAAGEFFLGTSVYRSMIQFNSLPHKTPPDAPSYLKNVNAWLEGFKVRKKRATPPDVDDSLVTSIAKDIAADVAIDLTALQVKNILKNRIPKILTKGANRLVLTPIAKSVLTDLVLKSGINATVQLSKLAATGLSYLTSVFAVYSIATIIVDIVDPFNYNHIISNDLLKLLNKKLDYEYFESNQTEIEITPEVLFNEEDESDATVFMISKMKEYMVALYMVEAKDRVEIQKKVLKKPSKNYSNSLNTLLTCIIILCSTIFMHHVAFFSLIYFYILYIILKSNEKI